MPCGTRDLALEFLSAAAISAMHLSRFAEEIVIWCSAPWHGFIRLSDAFTTGSSIMPQKRNPDAAELVRGKAGRVYGALVGCCVMKGLPLAYNKDMQEDKEPVFDAPKHGPCAGGDGRDDRTSPPIRRAWGIRRVRLCHGDGSGRLARAHAEAPFRSAHHITGTLVGIAEQKGVALADLSLDDMRTVEPGITEEVFSVLTVEASVASRTSFGGTAPANVAREAARWLAALA